MLKTIKIIPKSLSVRISLMAVLAIAVLLSAALFTMLHYARKTVKEEALQKADQTLEGTVRQIDNILLSVEQSAGNIYWDMLSHLDQPERMELYSRKVVETNPNIVGCAILNPIILRRMGNIFKSMFTGWTPVGLRFPIHLSSSLLPLVTFHIRNSLGTMSV